jgi:raffinose/stachyose/melibiose transport system substrate-binding protein
MTRTSARAMALALTVATMATAAACGPVGTGPDTPEGAAPAGGLTAWALTGGSDVVVEASVNDWNYHHPDQPLEVSWLENDEYKARIGDAVAAGTPPTLVLGWAGNDLDRLVADGDVVDLTGRVDPLLARTLPSVADNGTIDGRTYAVPNNQTQPVLLYHNADVLAEVGVEPPETFAELLDAVHELRDAGVQPIALAGGSKWPELMYIQYLTDRIGGPEVFRRIAEGEPGSWSDPAILAALRKIRALVEAGAFGDDFEAVVADASGDTSLVAFGQAAFVLQGAWVYPDFMETAPLLVSDGDLGYSPFPVVDGGTGDAANIVGNPANFWSVSADAAPAAQEAAIGFLNEQVLGEDEARKFLAVRTVPPVLGLRGQLDGLQDADYLGAVYDMVSSAPHFQLSWDQALPPDQAGALLDNLHGVFTGEVSPQAFVDAMNATL